VVAAQARRCGRVKAARARRRGQFSCNIKPKNRSRAMTKLSRAHRCSQRCQNGGFVAYNGVPHMKQSVARRETRAWHCGQYLSPLGPYSLRSIRFFMPVIIPSDAVSQKEKARRNSCVGEEVRILALRRMKLTDFIMVVARSGEAVVIFCTGLGDGLTNERTFWPGRRLVWRAIAWL